MKNKLIIITALLLISFTTHLVAQDWPQYLGPNRNSTSEQKNILRSWPETGPEVLWSVDIGKGYGGPVIKDEKVYFLDRDDEVGDVMRCFDLNNGTELWRFEYSAPGLVMFPGSRSIPIVDDNFVYSCGHNGNLYCCDINTGKPVWNKNIWTDFGGIPAPTDGSRSREPGSFPIWAISQNPMIYNNLLIVASQAPEAGVVAYDKTTGEIMWKTPNLGNETYASPSLVKIHGEDHISMVISSTNSFGNPDAEYTLGKVVGIDPNSGEIRWQYKNWNCHISVANPVEAGDNKLLIVGGYELGATMIKVEKQADGTFTTKEIFTTEEFGDQTKPPILHDGYFYAQYGTNRRRDGLVCMNMDGEIMWKTKRDPDFNKGSMILADGVILATDGAKSLYLIEPDPKEFKQIAKSDLLDLKAGDERMAGRFANQNWAPIALADGKLLIRDQIRMMCLKVAE